MQFDLKWWYHKTVNYYNNDHIRSILYMTILRHRRFIMFVSMVLRAIDTGRLEVSAQEHAAVP